MKQFSDFLKQNGIPNANALVSFLDNFSKYPEMILNMSDTEINHYEAQMDSAIGAVRQCSAQALGSREI
jgi:hypothetical protein